MLNLILSMLAAFLPPQLAVQPAGPIVNAEHLIARTLELVDHVETLCRTAKDTAAEGRELAKEGRESLAAFPEQVKAASRTVLQCAAILFLSGVIFGVSSVYVMRLIRQSK